MTMLKRLLPALAAVTIVAANTAHAQLDGTRAYWTLPKNFNVMAVHSITGTANATWVNLQHIQPTLDIENQLYLLTFTRSQPTFGRSTWYTAALPAGVIKTNSSLPVATNDPFVHGVGDPSLSVTMNLFGAPGLMLREFVRYDQRTTVSLGMKASLPIGQYDAEEPLNVGSNQFKLRASLPIVHSLGPWVPGSRTTLEVAPSLTWLADNDDSQGNTVEQDPLTAVETHLTRDITRRAFLSLDYSYIRFGSSTARDNTSGTVTQVTDATSAHLLGGTVNFQINDNLSLFLTHMQTFSPEDKPVVLEGALSRVTLAWSWHRVIERRRNLSE